MLTSVDLSYAHLFIMSLKKVFPFKKLVKKNKNNFLIIQALKFKKNSKSFCCNIFLKVKSTMRMLFSLNYSKICINSPLGILML